MIYRPILRRPIRLSLGISALALLWLISGPVIVGAEPLKMEVGMGLLQVIQAQQGQKLTLKLRSGAELSGTLRAVNGQLVHLGELTGKEFYDAFIDITQIEAVILRVK